MMPSIGFLTYALERAHGGIARYTRELLSALLQLGIPVVPLNAGGADATHRGIALRGSSRLPVLLTLGQLQIGQAARQQQLALVHDPTATMPLALTGARRVMSIYDVIPYIHPATSTTLDRLIYRWWLPFAVRHVDQIITISEQSKADIVRYLRVAPEKIAVTYLAAHPRFRPVSSVETIAVLKRYGIRSPYLFYIGSTDARKNLPRLLEAFCRVYRLHPEYQLVLAGVGEGSSSPLYPLIAHLKLESAVRLPGYIPDRDLPALYGGARAFVFPSLYEGFGLPVLEALSCGTPVLTSNVSSLPEVTGTAALLVNPYDSMALANALHDLITDKQLTITLREAGLHRAAMFSWERVARTTAAIYQQVLARAVHPVVTEPG
jgi:glycosyltransferase involved in cell wall biosynthesis